MSKNKTLSGYTCPFVKEACVYMDSLSMTKTIICNHCENFMAEKKANKVVNISFSFVKDSIQIPTN